MRVNDQSPYRKGEYYWKELSINNASAAVWQSVTNIASLSGTNQTNIGNLFLAKTAETFAYDLDGNMTNDGRFAYTWDAENRMTKAESYSTAPTGSKRKVIYEYDGQGRMVRRSEYDGSSGSYALTNDTGFVRDGWASIADLNALSNLTLQRSYLWGLDLSGSRTGAGGVGGLAAVNSTGNGVQFCAMDGSGNIVATVKGSDGTVSGTYEYDPFGKAIRTTGSLVKENPFRFSTKRADDSVDLTLYEYRSYGSSGGQWLSRDPSQELVSANLYGFIGNGPISSFDPDGRIRVEAYDLIKYDCGGWSVTFHYTLDGGAECEGYIVQKVTVTSWYAGCGQSRTRTEESVWERIPQINPLRSFPSIESKVVDMSRSSIRRDTYGARGVEVEIKFFCNRPPLDFTGWVQDPTFGFSTRTPPSWWQNPSAPGEPSSSRAVSASWYCCCGLPTDGLYSVRPPPL